MAAAVAAATDAASGLGLRTQSKQTVCGKGAYDMCESAPGPFTGQTPMNSFSHNCLFLPQAYYLSRQRIVQLLRPEGSSTSSTLDVHAAA